MASYYGDEVVWYLHKYQDIVIPFFSKVIADKGSYQDTYSTVEELYRRVGTEAVNYFSVEVSGDSIVLTLQVNQGESGFITSFGLIATFDAGDGEEKEYLVGKIMCANLGGETNQNISRTINRIYVLPLPKHTVNGRSALPKFYPIITKSGTPNGAELISVEEHHHAVEYSNRKDGYPSLSSSNFYESAQRKWIDTTKLPNQSYLYGEFGELQPTHSDMTGQLTTGSGFLDGKRDRNLASDFADVLINVLEVIVMASNRIQIYGKNIPTESSFTSEDRYVLTVDKTESSADRQLRAISYQAFRDGIIKKYSVGDSITSSIGVMETSQSITSFTFSSELRNALLIVINSNTEITDAPITIGTVSAYAGDAVLVMWQNGSYTCRSLGGSAMRVYQEISSGRLTLDNPNIKTLVVGDIYFNSTENTATHMFRNSSGYVEIGDGTSGRIYAPEGFYAE